MITPALFLEAPPEHQQPPQQQQQPAPAELILPERCINTGLWQCCLQDPSRCDLAHSDRSPHTVGLRGSVSAALAAVERFLVPERDPVLVAPRAPQRCDAPRGKSQLSPPHGSVEELVAGLQQGAEHLSISLHPAADHEELCSFLIPQLREGECTCLCFEDGALLDVRTVTWLILPQELSCVPWGSSAHLKHTPKW